MNLTPIATGGGSIVVFLAVLGILSKNSGNSGTTVTPTSTTSATTTTTSTNNTGTVTDGTYTSTINYAVPHGATSSVTVTVTIAGGVISNVSTAYNEGDRESVMYDNSFDAEYKTLVVGKKPANISLSQVGGASLTSNAFMRAINDIVSQSTH